MLGFLDVLLLSHVGVDLHASKVNLLIVQAVLGENSGEIFLSLERCDVESSV